MKPKAGLTPECNELAAQEIIYVLISAEGRFQASHKGWSDNLQALDFRSALPGHMPVWVARTGAVVARGSGTEFRAAGYEFHYAPPIGDPGATFGHYDIEARPVQYGTKGRRSFLLLSDGFRLHVTTEDRGATTDDGVIQFSRDKVVSTECLPGITPDPLDEMPGNTEGSSSAAAPGSAAGAEAPKAGRQEPSSAEAASAGEDCGQASVRERRMVIAVLELVIAQNEERPLPSGARGEAAKVRRNGSRDTSLAQIEKCRAGPPPLPADDPPPAKTLDEKRLRYFGYLSESERNGLVELNEQIVKQTEASFQEKCSASGGNVRIADPEVCADMEYSIRDLKRQIELVRRAPPAQPSP